MEYSTKAEKEIATQQWQFPLHAPTIEHSWLLSRCQMQSKRKLVQNLQSLEQFWGLFWSKIQEGNLQFPQCPIGKLLGSKFRSFTIPCAVYTYLIDEDTFNTYGSRIWIFHEYHILGSTFYSQYELKMQIFFHDWLHTRCSCKASTETKSKNEDE